jgi:hypothetical protein
LADDASQPSQAAQATPRTAELKDLYIKLAARVAAIQAQLDRQAGVREILDDAGYLPEPPPPRRKPKRPNPHGLHVVRGLALLAAGGAGWVLRTRARRAVAGAATVALVTGGTLAPDLMQPAPAATPPHHAVVHHEHGTTVPPVPAAAPPRHARRPRAGATAGPSPGASPSAVPSSAVPLPQPPVTPVPLPSVTVPPPVPAPSCTLLTGKHCHDGDVPGDVPGALRGLPGLP